MVWIDVYSIRKIRPHLYSTNFRIILGRKKWNSLNSNSLSFAWPSLSPNTSRRSVGWTKVFCRATRMCFSGGSTGSLYKTNSQASWRELVGRVKSFAKVKNNRQSQKEKSSDLCLLSLNLHLRILKNTFLFQTLSTTARHINLSFKTPVTSFKTTIHRFGSFTMCWNSSWRTSIPSFLLFNRWNAFRGRSNTSKEA